MKQHKIQNRSPKNSHSCVPLKRHRPLQFSDFLNFDLEFSIRVQSSEQLNTKIPPNLLLLRHTGCMFTHCNLFRQSDFQKKCEYQQLLQTLSHIHINTPPAIYSCYSCPIFQKVSNVMHKVSFKPKANKGKLGLDFWRGPPRAYQSSDR